MRLLVPNIDQRATTEYCLKRGEGNKQKTSPQNGKPQLYPCERSIGKWLLVLTSSLASAKPQAPVTSFHQSYHNPAAPLHRSESRGAAAWPCTLPARPDTSELSLCVGFDHVYVPSLMWKTHREHDRLGCCWARPWWCGSECALWSGLGCTGVAGGMAMQCPLVAGGVVGTQLGVSSPPWAQSCYSQVAQGLYFAHSSASRDQGWWSYILVSLLLHEVLSTFRIFQLSLGVWLKGKERDLLEVAEEHKRLILDLITLDLIWH